MDPISYLCIAYDSAGEALSVEVHTYPHYVMREEAETDYRERISSLAGVKTVLVSDAKRVARTLARHATAPLDVGYELVTQAELSS